MLQRFLASFAGAAAGSVVTWMAMDNEMMKIKAAHRKAIESLKAERMKSAEPSATDKACAVMAFGALATGTITALTSLARR